MQDTRARHRNEVADIAVADACFARVYDALNVPDAVHAVA